MVWLESAPARLVTTVDVVGDHRFANGGGSPAWPSYNSSSQQNMEIGDQVMVNAGLFKAQCDLSEKIYAGGKP